MVNTNRIFKVFLLALILISVLIVSLYGGALSSAHRLNWEKEQPDLLITDITVITNNLLHPEIPEQNVLIQKGIITTITSDLSDILLDSTTVKVIDGKGKYVIPGLIDVHAHIEDSSYLALGLANGITSIRGMRGNDRQLTWRNEINEKKWLGSRFLVSSPILDGTEGDMFHHFIETPEHGEQAVKEYSDKGYDYIKLYGEFNSETYIAIIEQAQKQNIPVSKHGPFPVNGLGFNSLITLTSLEHIEDIFSHEMHYNYNPELLADLATIYNEINVPIVTTLSVYEELTQLSVQGQDYLAEQPLEYMNPAHLILMTEFGIDRWLNASEKEAKLNQSSFANLLKITKFLHDNNVQLLVGSDSGALIGQTGLATIREIELLGTAGLSNHSALLAATFNNALALHIDSDYGSVEQGKVADLVILENNPLLNLSALRDVNAVVIDGYYLNQQKLNSLKNNALDVQSKWLTFPSIVIDTIRLMFK